MWRRNNKSVWSNAKSSEMTSSLGTNQSKPGTSWEPHHLRRFSVNLLEPENIEGQHKMANEELPVVPQRVNSFGRIVFDGVSADVEEGLHEKSKAHKIRPGIWKSHWFFRPCSFLLGHDGRDSGDIVREDGLSFAVTAFTISNALAFTVGYVSHDGDGFLNSKGFPLAKGIKLTVLCSNREY